MQINLSLEFNHTLPLQQTRAALLDLLRSYELSQPAPSKLNPVYRSVLSLSLVSGRDLTVDDKTGAAIPRQKLPPIQLLATARKPKTAAKAALWDWLYSHGWQPSTAFPDFLAVHAKTQRLALLVATKHRGRKPKRQQNAVIQLLAACGVPCFSWSPDSGFARIGLQEPASPPEKTTPVTKCTQIQQQNEDKEAPCIHVSSDNEDDSW